MELPVQITFRDVPPSQAVEQRIYAKAQKLNRYYDRIIGCRVLVEQSGRHRQRGRLFHVRVDLTVPGAELIANRDPSAHHGHVDVYVAIRDAFEAAHRQLEAYGQKQQHKRKVHEIPPHGVVTRLFPEDGYGFILAPDGEEVYFHRNAVTDGAFDAIQVGAEVRFALHDGEGDEGPQASAVAVIGKHHLPDRTKDQKEFA